MGFQGRGNVIAVTSVDPVLSYVGAVGLAMSAGSGLVVDMCETTNGRRTLADLDEDGPRLDELSPGRRGVAVLAGGPIEPERARTLISDLAQRWPCVVIRSVDPAPFSPCVPLVPLYPGWLRPSGSSPAAWQPLGHLSRAPGPGPVLPRLHSRFVSQVLSGRHPRPNRWTRALTHVWEMPWD